MASREEIVKNFRKELSVIRGKIYTFDLKQVTSASNSTKDWFYLTTVPPEQRVNPFDGVITEGVSISKEIISNPTLSLMYANTESGTPIQRTPFIHWLPIPFLGWGGSLSQTHGLTYSHDGYFQVDSSQIGSKSLKYKQAEIPGGYYYQYTLQVTEYGGGNIEIFLGHARSGQINSAGTFTGIIDTTEAIPGLKQELHITYDQDFLGRIAFISLKRVGACSENLVFTPNFEHPDTIYYESSKDLNMGNKINILNERGPTINSEERYYTLGINQTNRTYAPHMKSDPDIVNKFLKDGLPGGLYKNIFNRAPSGTVASDRPTKTYYDAVNGDQTVSLSGLISDPENDTLNYRWTHFAPKKTMDGVSLLTNFEDPTSLETEATLVVPPTDMIYTLHLEVADSDNITTIPINIKVSGTVEFDSWTIGSGINTFDLGDSNVPFEDLD